MTGLEELLQAGELGTQYGGNMDPMAAEFFAVFAGAGVIILALIVLLVVSRCFVFKKMGNQWYEALISGHNLFVIITNAGKPGRWAFAPVLIAVASMLSGGVNGNAIGAVLVLFAVLVYVWVSVSIGLARKFGKGVGFGVGLSLLPFIFYPILAWGKSKYKKTTRK